MSAPAAGNRTTSRRARAWWGRIDPADQDQIIVWLLENPPRSDCSPIEHAFRELHQATYRPVKGGAS